MNPTVVQSVLAGVILAAILWLAKSTQKNGETLAVLKTVLVGANGDNGINSRVSHLEDRSEQHASDLLRVNGRHDLLKQRVDGLEERAS